MIRQTNITVSGCQNWSRQILATSKSYFAFASTIAVYVYDIKTYQLQKLLTSQTSNITALKWEPVTERYLAQATLDKKIVLWDIQTEQVKFEVQLNSHAIHIEWDFASPNNLLIVLSNGELKSIDLVSKLVSQIEFGSGKPTICK